MPQAGANRKKIKCGSVRTEKKTKRTSKGTARPTLTAAQLFDRAQQALAFERYDTATECLRDALQLEPENIEVLDAYGALLAELGQIDEAVQVSCIDSTWSWSLPSTAGSHVTKYSP